MPSSSGFAKKRDKKLSRLRANLNATAAAPSHHHCVDDNRLQMFRRLPAIYSALDNEDVYKDEAGFTSFLQKNGLVTPDVLNHVDDQVGTPLIFAICHTHVSAWKVKILLELGANPRLASSVIKNGFFHPVEPIVVALTMPQLSTARLLMIYGASLDVMTTIRLPSIKMFSGNKAAGNKKGGINSVEEEDVPLNPVATIIAFSLIDLYVHHGNFYMEEVDPSLRVAWVLDNALPEVIASWDLTRLGSCHGLLTLAVFNQWWHLAVKLLSMEQVDLKYVDPAMKLDVFGIACAQGNADFLDSLMDVSTDRRPSGSTAVPSEDETNYSIATPHAARCIDIREVTNSIATDKKRYE